MVALSERARQFGPRTQKYGYRWMAPSDNFDAATARPAVEIVVYFDPDGYASPAILRSQLQRGVAQIIAQLEKDANAD